MAPRFRCVITQKQWTAIPLISAISPLPGASSEPPPGWVVRVPPRSAESGDPARGQDLANAVED